jgi:hypothetical protein
MYVKFPTHVHSIGKVKVYNLLDLQNNCKNKDNSSRAEARLDD